MQENQVLKKYGKVKETWFKGKKRLYIPFKPKNEKIYNRLSKYDKDVMDFLINRLNLPQEDIKRLFPELVGWEHEYTHNEDGVIRVLKEIEGNFRVYEGEEDVIKINKRELHQDFKDLIEKHVEKIERFYEDRQNCSGFY